MGKRKQKKQQQGEAADAGIVKANGGDDGEVPAKKPALQANKNKKKQEQQQQQKKQEGEQEPDGANDGGVEEQKPLSRKERRKLKRQQEQKQQKEAQHEGGDVNEEEKKEKEQEADEEFESDGHDDLDLTDVEVHPKLARLTQTQKAKKTPSWTNRQRTLVFASRGISFRVRHLVSDLRAILPHSKKDVKLDRKDRLGEIIPEICEMRNCNNAVFVEMRKKRDCYMWVAKAPHGPSTKFYVQNIHTMDELRLTGNCLRGSRPLVHFSNDFDTTPHYKLIKELLFQAFAVPNHHPKSKPFVDHVMAFYILDERIWFRHYQIAWKPKGKLGRGEETRLVEIGPRLVLQPIRTFEGSFGGPTLFKNEGYERPGLKKKRAQAAAKAMEEAKAAVQQHQQETEQTSNPEEGEEE